MIALSSFSTGNVGAANERFIPRDMLPCTVENASSGYDVPCKENLPVERIATELGKLAGTNFAYEIRDDMLTVTVRMTPVDASYPRGPFLCCEIQAYLDKISQDVYSARFRWSRMQTGMLDLQFLNVKDRPDTHFQHNGSPRFVFANTEADKDLIARSGAELNADVHAAGDPLGTHKLAIFKGAACRKTVTRCSVIYMPDGQYAGVFATNALANKVDTDRFVIVGVYNTAEDSSDTRIEELLLGYNDARYDAFMRFVTHDLRQQIERGERPLRRYAAGLSNGGSWAHNALVSQGGYFDGAIIMSPGERKTRDERPLADRVAIVGAGFMERNFYESTLKIAASLKARGAIVNEVYVPSGHGLNTWVNVWNTAITHLNSQAKNPELDQDWQHSPLMP